MKVIYFILILLMVACSDRFTGYEEQDSGLYFKLITIEDSSKRISETDYVQFKYLFSDYNNTELASDRILLKVNNTDHKGSLSEALALLNEKEIGEFIFPLSKLKSDLDGSLLLKGLADTTMLFAKVQIDSIYSEAGFKLAQDRFTNWVNQVDTTDFDVFKEQELMDAFEIENKIESKSTGTGLRYFKIKSGNGKSISFGKRITISYRGSFLNGAEFNSTKQLENGVQDFYFGQELQVIKGIEEALLFMKEGDVTLLLLPSWIAFGENGSSTGIVPPKTPVYYEVEVKKVN
jgi:FKBP-type peptidyl-prolyl cis-trans isomerase